MQNQTKSLSGVKLFATYLGGAADDVCLAVAVDSDGNIYITGRTNSADFPSTSSSSIQASKSIGSDCIVVKLRRGTTSKCSQFTQLLTLFQAVIAIATYYGGDGDETCTTIALDEYRNIYFGGGTASTNLPSQLYGFSGGSGRDGFWAKIGWDGVVFSLYCF